MRTEAIKRYEIAAEYFKKEKNTDSYACALRDIGREYAQMDSLSHALNILIIADSVAANTSNINVTASINNALGNIYSMQNKYDKAEEYLLKALLTGREKMPDYVALIDLYTASNSINKAKELLSKIPQDTPNIHVALNIYIIKFITQKKTIKKLLLI